MSAREKCKPVEGKTVYDRLTNPAGYTGQYAAKFGTTTSKSTAKSQQSTGNQATQQKKIQLSEQQKTTQNSQKQQQKQQMSVYDRLSDVNSYTGAYRQRFDKDGHGIGSERIAKGGDDPNGLQHFVARK